MAKRYRSWNSTTIIIIQVTRRKCKKTDMKNNKKWAFEKDSEIYSLQNLDDIYLFNNKK